MHLYDIFVPGLMVGGEAPRLACRLRLFPPRLAVEATQHKTIYSKCFHQYKSIYKYHLKPIKRDIRGLRDCNIDICLSTDTNPLHLWNASRSRFANNGAGNRRAIHITITPT